MFDIPEPTAAEDPAVAVVWYDSADGAAFAPIGEEQVVNLDVDPLSEKYVWPLEVADTARYQMLKTRSAGGIESAFGALLPPLPANPGLQTVFGTVKEFGSPDWAEGDIVEATMKGNQLNSGTIVEPVTAATTVNANGLFSLPLDKGCDVTLQVKDAASHKPYFTRSFTVNDADQMDIKDY